MNIRHVFDTKKKLLTVLRTNALSVHQHACHLRIPFIEIDVREVKIICFDIDLFAFRYFLDSLTDS